MSVFDRVRMIGGTMTPSVINSGTTGGHELDGDCFIPICNGGFCLGFVSLECNDHSQAELVSTSCTILENMRVSGETGTLLEPTFSPLRSTSA